MYIYVYIYIYIYVGMYIYTYIYLTSNPVCTFSQSRCCTAWWRDLLDGCPRLPPAYCISDRQSFSLGCL